MAQSAITVRLDSEMKSQFDELCEQTHNPIRPEVANALISHIIEYGINASRVDFAEAMPDEDDRVFYEVKACSPIGKQAFWYGAEVLLMVGYQRSLVWMSSAQR